MKFVSDRTLGGDVEAAKTLVSYEANIHAIAGGAYTPCDLARKNCNTEVEEYLSSQPNWIATAVHVL